MIQRNDDSDVHERMTPRHVFNISINTCYLLDSRVEHRFFLVSLHHLLYSHTPRYPHPQPPLDNRQIHPEQNIVLSRQIHPEQNIVLSRQIHPEHNIVLSRQIHPEQNIVLSGRYTLNIILYFHGRYTQYIILYCHSIYTLYI